MYSDLSKEVQNDTRPHLPEGDDDTISKLIRRCWSPNPSNRPTFEEIPDPMLLGMCLCLLVVVVAGQLERGNSQQEG